MGERTVLDGLRLQIETSGTETVYSGRIMLTFVTIAALALALIVFLNALNLPTSAGAKKSPANIEKPVTLDTARILRMKAAERPRICPVCGTPLSQDEYLIAAIFPDPGPNQKRQAHIYGCRHCYVSGGVNLTRVHPETLAEQPNVHSV